MYSSDHHGTFNPKTDTRTSRDIQKERIAIMANQVIRDLVSDSRGGFFFIICDKYTNISKMEQLTICIHFDGLTMSCKSTKISSVFIMYVLPDTASKTIVSVIKDVLLRLLLSLVNC